MRKKDNRPLQQAAALRYSEREQAPRLVAAGKGLVAQRIIENAKAEQVPIHVDPELAHNLNLLTLGSEIPPELYTVVARILLFVGDVDKLMSLHRPKDE